MSIQKFYDEAESWIKPVDEGDKTLITANSETAKNRIAVKIVELVRNTLKEGIQLNGDNEDKIMHDIITKVIEQLSKRDN